jgi:hypothetical protein
MRIGEATEQAWLPPVSSRTNPAIRFAKTEGNPAEQGQVLPGQTLLKEYNQAPIFFDRKNFFRRANSSSVTDPDPADFQNSILTVRCLDNPPQLVAIVKKRPNDFVRRIPPAANCLSFRKAIGRLARATPAKTRTTARSCRSEIVRGGVKPITLACSPRNRM